MKTSESLSIYTVGGTVQAANGLYISRQADSHLLSLCQKSEYAYILTTRQVGKSSLMVRTAAQLKDDGIRTVILSLELLGTSVSEEAWYLGFLVVVEEGLQLKTDVMEWWQECGQISPTQKFERFFREVLLQEVKEQIVIFVDEIDTTLGLAFSADFFAIIRHLYLSRATVEELNRLSFVLIGVATPTDLIDDPTRTPFNIGHRVELTDFNLNEALPLAQGFGLPPAEAQQVLGWVLDWTEGHPVLTQQLCHAIASENRSQWSEANIESIVRTTFFGAAKERNSNLQFVRDMLTLSAKPNPEEVLRLYRQVLRKLPPVIDSDSLVKSHLKLSGVVRRENGILRLRNRIYAQTFDLNWVRENLSTQARRLELLERMRLVAQRVIIALALTATLIAGIALRQNMVLSEQSYKLSEQSKALEVARKQSDEYAIQYLILLEPTLIGKSSSEIEKAYSTDTQIQSVANKKHWDNIKNVLEYYDNATKLPFIYRHQNLRKVFVDQDTAFAISDTFYFPTEKTAKNRYWQNGGYSEVWQFTRSSNGWRIKLFRGGIREKNIDQEYRKLKDANSKGGPISSD